MTPAVLQNHPGVGERVVLHLRLKHDKMDEMLKVMVPMGTDQVESHTATTFRRINICRTP